MFRNGSTSRQNYTCTHIIVSGDRDKVVVTDDISDALGKEPVVEETPVDAPNQLDDLSEAPADQLVTETLIRYVPFQVFWHNAPVVMSCT